MSYATLCLVNRLPAVSLFSQLVEQNAQDTKITARVTEGVSHVERQLPILTLKKKKDYCGQSTL